MIIIELSCITRLVTSIYIYINKKKKQLGGWKNWISSLDPYSLKGYVQVDKTNYKKVLRSKPLRRKTKSERNPNPLFLFLAPACAYTMNLSPVPSPSFPILLIVIIVLMLVPIIVAVVFLLCWVWKYPHRLRRVHPNAANDNWQHTSWSWFHSYTSLPSAYRSSRGPRLNL